MRIDVGETVNFLEREVKWLYAKKLAQLRVSETTIRERSNTARC